MPTNYPGNPLATQAPAYPPAFDNVPVLSLPADADGLNTSSVLQAFKCLADYTAWVIGQVAPYRGIRLWNSGTTYTTGHVVVSPADARLYRALQESLNEEPDGNSAYWSRCDYSEAEIRGIAADYVEATAGWTVSHGASIARATMVSFAYGLMKIITFTLASVPFNNYADVDLNGATTKLASLLTSVQVSVMSDGYTYGCQVGSNPNIGGDPNVVRVWCKPNAGHPGSLADVGVTIVGY